MARDRINAQDAVKHATERIVVRYWTCRNKDHRHKSESAARKCVGRHREMPARLPTLGESILDAVKPSK